MLIIQIQWIKYYAGIPMTGVGKFISNLRNAVYIILQPPRVKQW